jgi:predicted TIM-barrel fold metal-dependent hydrolase
MLTIAQRVGIDRIGVFIRTDVEANDHPSNDEIERVFEQYRGQAFGFVWVSLVEDAHHGLDKLNRWVGDGPLVGLKLGGMSGHCNEAQYDPVFRRAVDLKAVIYIHTWIKVGGDPPYPGGGNLAEESYPWEVVELAGRYPDYPFICGHAGGDWELGIAALRHQENVLCEISGGYPRAGLVEMAVRELGARRVIYGSDVTGRSFSTQLAKVHGADVSEQDKQLIFNGNAERLMRPICQAKGISI